MPATRSTRNQKRLDRDEVARAALAIADAEGIDGLSMRRLADELGIGTMTLYGYFRSKRELLDAAVDMAAEQFAAPTLRGTPRRRLRVYMEAVREWLEQHPSLVHIRGEAPIVRQGAFRVSEGAMQILIDAGLPPAEAAYGFRLLFTYVFGSVAFGLGEPSPEQRRATTAAVLALPPEEFPALLAAASGAGDALGGRRPFEYGLEVLLDGLESRLARG